MSLLRQPLGSMVDASDVAEHVLFKIDVLLYILLDCLPQKFSVLVLGLTLTHFSNHNRIFSFFLVKCCKLSALHWSKHLI